MKTSLPLGWQVTLLQKENESDTESGLSCQNQ